MPQRIDSSWEKVEDWYSHTVGEKGHYYHQELILPRLAKVFGFSPKIAQSILDLGCGQGVLARTIPENQTYVGIDASPSLIAKAKSLSTHPLSSFFVGDATQKLPIEKTDFDFVSMILSIQNMASPIDAIHQARNHLKKGGRLIIVMNHPYFRIPRQSEWGVDEKRQMQYRKVFRYMSHMEIPIQMRPSQKEQSMTTISYHYPLSDYFQFLAKNRFTVRGLEEWCSEKKSVGKKAKMEDCARREFPLFLLLDCLAIS